MGWFKTPPILLQALSMLEDWFGNAWPRRSEMQGPSRLLQLQGFPSPHEEKVTPILLFDSWNIQTNSFMLNVLPLFVFCPWKNVQLRMKKKNKTKPRIFQLTEGLHFLKTLKLPKMFLNHGNWSACRGMLFLSQAIFQFSSYPATASFCFFFSFDYVHLSPKCQSFKVWHKL